MRFIRKLNTFNERRRVKGTAEAYDRFWTAGFYRLCQEPPPDCGNGAQRQVFSQMLYANVSQKRV